MAYRSYTYNVEIKETIGFTGILFWNFISSGIDDISDICDFLGVNKTTINNAVAVLQKNSLITVDIFCSKLKLTDKGETDLKEALTIVPEDIEYALYVDGLLGNVYLDTRKIV